MKEDQSHVIWAMTNLGAVLVVCVEGFTVQVVFCVVGMSIDMRINNKDILN